MHNSPFFSIVIPVFNAEDYLYQCIESIWSQSYGDYEIIMIDDGSTDGSLDICRELAMKDDRIKLFKQDNAGPSKSRNRGIVESVGKWLVFVDADDRIGVSSFLEDLKASIDNYKPEVVFYGFKNIRGDNENIVRVMCDDVEFINQTLCLNDKIKWCIDRGDLTTSSWSHACSREFIIKNDLYFDEALLMSEDVEWTFRLLSYKPAICGLSGAPYLYVVRNNSICTSAKKNQFSLYLEKAIDSISKTIKFNVEDVSFRDILYSGLAYHYYIHLGDIFNEPDKNYRKQALRNIRKYKFLQKYKADKRTNVARIIVKMFGTKGGGRILNYYMMFNARRKGQPIRSEDTISSY